jgi:hypothetical protein
VLVTKTYLELELSVSTPNLLSLRRRKWRRLIEFNHCINQLFVAVTKSPKAANVIKKRVLFSSQFWRFKSLF